MNGFIDALSQTCREYPLERKLLLVPNLRAGHQWLESVARSGQPAVNLHIKTLRGFVMDLAGPSREEQGLAPLLPIAAVFLMEKVWLECQGDLKYLPTERMGTPFLERLHATLLQIRLAGLTSQGLVQKSFEVPDKANDIGLLLASYEQELARSQQVDYPGSVRLALARIERNPTLMPELGLILYPSDLEWNGLEKHLLGCIPADQLKVLTVDHPGACPAERAFFRAAGEVNEVREVVRRCLKAQVPLDQVEVLVSAPETYIPLFHELAERLRPDKEREQGDEPEPPALRITFADGIPSRYSRPARALSAWLDWMREDRFLQPTLVAMIREGLLEQPGGGQIPFSRLADCLQPLPIGHGRDRYLEAIQHKIRLLEDSASKLPSVTEDGEPLPEEKEVVISRRTALETLQQMVAGLLSVCPPPSATPLQIVEMAGIFLEKTARAVGELDDYARKKYLEEINEMKGLLSRVNTTAFSAREWLGSLGTRVSLLGNSPRPGHMHVSSLSSGGHSGRPHTFILGLDDGRFPGGGLQDPLLLDSERSKLSGDLTQASGRLQRKMESFHLLLARLRGRVTLSYTCRDLLQDREGFPSSVLSQWLEPQPADPERVSFAPSNSEGCLSESEWWLQRLVSRPENTVATGVIAERFPHLGQGLLAAGFRESAQFTEYDGHIGHQPHLDPFSSQGPSLSANSLQTLGRCPLAYLFKYGLEIEKPQEMAPDPDVWLDALEAGSLLHEVFREFVQSLIDEKRMPSYDRDWETIRRITGKRIAEARKRNPPLNEGVFRKQELELQTAARIFLQEEEAYASLGTPVYLEANLGLRACEARTEIDTENPIPIRLPGGGIIRAKGRIDRIDRVDAHTWKIWDYKTGGTTPYRKGLPCKEGRLIQHVLYIVMVQKRLDELGFKAADVTEFGFFFPGHKGQGERICFGSEVVTEGMPTVENLCRISSTGAFLSTQSSDDCRYCDYAQICHPVEETVARSLQKLVEDPNQILQPMRDLRGIKNG